MSAGASRVVKVRGRVIVTKSVRLDRTNSGPTEGFNTSWRSGSHMFQRHFRAFQHFLIPTPMVAKTLVARERLHPVTHLL